MFESTRTIGWSDAESYFGDCDDRLIKQIIDKGRFSNQIAKALHEEKKTEMQYNLPVSGQSTMNHLNYKHSQSQLLSGGCSEKIFGKLGTYTNSSDNMLSKATYEQQPLQTISEETPAALAGDKPPPSTTTASQATVTTTAATPATSITDMDQILKVQKRESTSYFHVNTQSVAAQLSTKSISPEK